MKRLLDIGLSLLTIAVLLPVFVVISIAIKLSGKSPAIFRQERAGKNVIQAVVEHRLKLLADK